MYFTVYKITNTINGKIYIGVHKTTNLNDDYMGSGVILKKAQEKYGLENFKKEYIKVFDNADDMFYMESMLVDDDFILREDTYNLHKGGSGGFTKSEASLGRKAANATLKEKYGDEWNKIIASMGHTNRTPEMYQQAGLKAAQTVFKKYGHGTFTGKQHSQASKNKIGAANSKHQTGKGNSQYGTCWVHSLVLKQSKKIKCDALDIHLQDGWIKGRKMKF